MGPLKFSTPLLLHARRSDPGRPSGVSPNRRLRVGFRLVNNVATCSDAFNEAHFASGWCGHPSGLQHTLSTLHRYCSPVLADPFHNHRSASSARLDRGGGLALAPRGLSPRQKRQASLDALTTQGQPRPPRASLGPRRSPGVGCSAGLGNDLVGVAECLPPPNHSLNSLTPLVQSIDRDGLPATHARLQCLSSA
jgi:hypothetical protein